MTQKGFTNKNEMKLPEVSEVLIDRHRINCQLDFPLDGMLRDTATMRTTLHHASDSFRFAMSSYMFKGYKGTETFHHVPETWWDHFKKTHFPKWALEKWPVRYTKLHETSYHLCPHGVDKWPHTNHIRFMYLGERRSEERLHPRDKH